MFYRKTILATCVCVATSAIGFGQGAGYLFQLSGSASPNGNYYPYQETANPFNPVVGNALGPSGVSQVIPKPDGSKFYLLGTSGANALQSVNSSFTSGNSINGLGTLPTAAVVTPDGKYLVVGADQLYIVDTNVDQIVATLALSSSPVVGIGISRDSRFAYVLTHTSFNNSTLTAYDLVQRAKSSLSPLAIPFSGANAIVMSPLGLLYISQPNRIYEVDPSTLTLTLPDGIAVTAEPGPARFTPDGTVALFVNNTPNIGGAALIEVALPSHVTSTWPQTFNPGSPPPVFTDVFIKDSGHAIALSCGTSVPPACATSSGNTLWDITTAPLNAVVSALDSNFQSIGNPLSAAISTEVPVASYLFLLAANGPQFTVSRINLSTNALEIKGAADLNTGILQFAPVPAQANPATFIQFNNPQTNLAVGATTLPLIARVLTASGVPVFNLPVTFTTDSATTALGLVINTPSATTNADGYVQTTVKMPLTPGSYTITLTAGIATTTFTVTIPGGTTCTTNCNNGGSSQVTIVSGDGQLLPEGSVSPLPLTVLVTDTTGAPVANVPVTFGVANGLGVVTPNAVTDKNGLASTTFTSESIQQGLGFQTATVGATAQSTATNYGSVTFTEVTFHLDSLFGGGLTGIPQLTLIAPSNSFTPIQLPRGTALPNAIKVQVVSEDSEQTGVPIPGVGIQTQNYYDPTQPPPATCQGATNSDSTTGTAHCTLIASCAAPLGLAPMTVLVGSFQYPVNGVTLNITGGTASSVKMLSTNLTGVVGQTITLKAEVDDGCGLPVPAQAVTWTIVQGSASFQSTVTTSNSQGAVSANVTLGQIAGLVQVRVTAAGVAQATFNITNNQTVGGLSLANGGGQSATINQVFATPLTFTVVDNSTPPKPVAGATVAFSVTTGTATLNPFSAASNAQGQVSTSVTAGATAGPIIVTASIGGYSASANLTSVAASLPITPASFTNAASGVAGLVPCGLGTLIGNGIATNVQGVISGVTAFGPLPYTLPPGSSNGFSMTIDGVAVPLYSISNQNGVQQVNFQTPCESPVGAPATAVITVNGGTTTVQGIQMLQAQPGIFTYAGPGGILYGAVISASDGSYVTPSNPAHIGQNYYLVATGLGQVSPPTKTNSAGIGGQNVPLTVIVGVSNAGVPVLGAQYAVGNIGAYVVEFTIPPGSPTGPNQPLALEVIVNGQPTFGNPIVPIYLPAVSN